MSTEEGPTTSLLKPDWLLIFVVLLIGDFVLSDRPLLAILFVLGLIYIELTSIRRAIEEKP